MNLNESIIKIRVELQNSKIRKSGKNEHGGFGYYELSDFLPKLNELMEQEKVNDNYTIEEGNAILTLIKGEEKQSYKMPFTMFEVPLTKSGNKIMQEIQYLGALNTYYKRYLYLNAFGITDGEVIDSINNNDLSARNEKIEISLELASKKQIDDVTKLAGSKLNSILEFEKTTLEKMSKDKATDIIKKLKGE